MKDFDEIGEKVTRLPGNKTVVGVPKVVTMGQAREILYDRGLLDVVDAFIKNATGTAGDKLRIAWDYRPTVERDSPLVISLAKQLNWTADDLDQLFIVASTL